MGEPRSILVYVGLDAVGDGLMKLPFLRALRGAFPQARITWLAGKGHTVYASVLAPLVAGLADEVIDDAGIGSRMAELVGPRPLPGRAFDLVIDTQRRFLTTMILRRVRHRDFISATAGFRLSSRRPASDWRRPAGMIGQLMALVGLAAACPLDVLPVQAQLAQDPVCTREAVRLLPDGPRYVGLAPGAGGRQKCWPLDRFLEVAELVTQTGAVPVFLLGPNETDWSEVIRSRLPEALMPLQQTSLPLSPMLTIAVARRLSVAVANDSGTGHMLAAAGVPLVSLFGPTPPEKFAPACPALRIVRAQDFGGNGMDSIPVRDVMSALSSF